MTGKTGGDRGGFRQGARPQHPAKAAQPKPAPATAGPRAPHPAKVAQPKPTPAAATSRAPHPAKVAQPKPTPAAATSRPPHPAAVVQRRAAHPPHAAAAPPPRAEGQPVAQPFGAMAVAAAPYVGGAMVLGGLAYGAYRLLYGGGGGGLDFPRGNLRDDAPEVRLRWADLFANPPQFLGAREMTPEARFMPAGPVESVGTQSIPRVFTYNCEGRHTDLVEALGGRAVGVKVLQAGTNTSREAVFVPWAQNQAHRVTLNNQMDVFMTDPLNGCGILIAGNRNGPTVIHANYYIGPEDPGIAEAAQLANRPPREHCNHLREAAYDELAQHLNMNNHYLFSPRAYYANGLGARVFGIRTNDGWTFYATTRAGQNTVTARIWPA
ncbi:hypothetical protein [Polyangium fumosum]|uniref:Uncharacterized protein n=1 Tax=Polyangium fumosum TaxID=889272 RepID=A0A4U1J1G6_9BACT|nr:hypothetical protein [Polyangium fumosum]TKD00912.1 hypothetical protein E8A74_32735 [Polyangium fumosum]